MPTYYARNAKGYSPSWIQVIKNSIARIAPHYTMKRQLDDYYTKFYNPLAARSKKLQANDNKLAKDIALWKENVAERWDSIHVVSAEKPDALKAGQIEAGAKYDINIVIDEAGLDNAIGVELVTLTTDKDNNDHIYSVEPLEVVKREGNLYTFHVTHTINNAGGFKIAYRIFPKNDKLPHRQDFCYVKWFL